MCVAAIVYTKNAIFLEEGVASDDDVKRHKEVGELP